MSSAAPVLLFGAGGQVGTELRRSFSDRDLITLDRTQADQSKPETLRAIIREARPAIILNAAAYTAVDRAESEPELADLVNHQAPRVLAEEAERLGALLVHYSTDYVFNGEKPGPWVETDATAPLNVYGASKLAGEQAIRASCERHLVLRTSWVYGPHGHNFMLTMLRLGRDRDVLRVVNDQHGAPTSSAALAQATRSMVNRVEERSAGAPASWAGVYHATCAGQTTWHGFAEAIFAASHPLNGRPTTVVPVPSSEYPTPAKRPRNSVLSNRKLAEQLGVALPPWDLALHSVLSTVAQESQHA